MYAIIRAGGKQAKVHSGDVLEIERVKDESEELTFAPLLVVDDKGNAVSDRETLAKASVTAKVLGESQGPKIDIFKYKNKTGNRRRQGHRQKYTRIEITGIQIPGAAKPKATAKPADSEGAAKPATTKPAAAKAAGAEGKTTSAKPAAKPAAAKAPAAKPGAAKTTKAAKPAASEEE
jgi:large subunit ribosomal protein L21